MARDPVCGKYVDQQKAEYRETYKDRTYYFCCPECMRKFKEAPERYAGGRR
jgi:YHS domain-containing protein